jgi:lysophospholipase L1-like esterase
MQQTLTSPANSETNSLSFTSFSESSRPSESEKEVSHPNPLRLVALGDSVIYGFGDPEGGGWVERLRRQWMTPGSDGHILYNLGIRGDGVRHVAKRLDHEFHHRGELRHQVPDLIILSVGTNDSARAGRPYARNVLAFEDFEFEMANLLDQAQRLCRVLFVGMTPIDEAKMPFSNFLYYNHADQYAYKESTRLACQERQIPYLDIFDLWMSRGEQWWRSRLCSDGLHPTSVGYAALLEDFLSWKENQL